ncbi:MAG: DUF4129 domain-containing protein [Gaiellaceae bacterium]
MGERLDRTIRAAAVGAGLLALLAIVAIASGRGRPGVSGTTDVVAVANVRDVVLTIGITFYVFALALVVWAFWSNRAAGGKLDRPAGLGSLLMFLLFALVIGWGINNRPEAQVEADEIPGGPVITEQQPPPQPREGAEPIRPAEFRWPLAVGLAVAGAAAVAGIVLLRRRAGEAELDPLAKRERAAAELAMVVEGTLDDLRREADPRRAVIAAYAQMERVLERHGLPRDRAEAPFEYLGRMLGELRVRPEAALALTELFERARFSDHEIDAAMKDEAIDALVSVRDDLRAS